MPASSPPPVEPSSPPEHVCGAWVRPKQQSIGLLDFDVEHYTTCSQCGSTIEGPAADDSGLVLAGRYRLRRLLGSGATALVYEGVDEKTERPVAVKLLHAAVRAKVGDFFLQEAKLAARVRSPHLIQASDFGEDQGRLFIVLELLPGRPLAALMQTSLLRWSEICIIALHVLDALAALHRAHAVHRDVKPDNIFVSSTVGAALHATLLDLGFAAILPSRRLTGAPEPVRAVFGTAGYIAPEIFGGLPPDPRNDLYSLGAVLYVALTGQPVPDYRTFPQIVLPSPRVFRPEVPEAVATVVLRALSDIEERYASAEEMAAAIVRALRDANVSPDPLVVPAAATAPESVRSTGGRWAPGRTLVAVAALGCALALRSGDADKPPPAPEPTAEPAGAAHALAVEPTAELAAESVTVAHDVPLARAALRPASEALEAARPSLRACNSSTSSLVIDVACERGEGQFSKVDVIGDETATRCARQVLDALRFAPGAAQAFTQEYGS